MSATPAVRLSTLGGVRCTTETGGLHSVMAQPRRIALLVYLALAQPRGFHSRDQLLALFWPDHDEQRARNALSQAVHFLRRALGADAIVSMADDQLRLNPELVWLDVIAFEGALAAGRTAEALELYGGPFLEAFHVSAAAAELDRWIDSERERLGRLYADALLTMARDREAAGDFAGAVEWHRRLAAHDPLSSRLALGLIHALAAAGDVDGALQHARIYETLSRAELDAPPDPEITAFVNELRQRTTVKPDVGHAMRAAGRDASGLGFRAGEASHSVPATQRWGLAKRRAMVGVGAMLAASLFFVLIASRKHAEEISRIGCVAVLPIENLSGDSALDHFTDAMTAAIITELGRYEPPHVLPRPSVLPFKGTTKTLPQIGRDLHCDGIIAANLTRIRNVAHIDAQILLAPEDMHLWTDSFEEDTSQMLFLERRVINGVTRHLRILAGRTRGMAPHRRVDSVAYAAYLRGRDAFRGWNTSSLQQAIALYQQAITLDSTFAPAYAGLADAYNIMGEEGYGPPSYLDSARTFAERALNLDSASSEAHTTKGFILTSDGDWTRAESEFTKAIELDRTNALAHLWYAVLLGILNRNEEGLSHIRLARDLDPMSQEIEGKRVTFQFLAGVKVSLGNPGNPRGWANPTHPASWATRAIAQARKGQCAEAYQSNGRAQELAPNNTIMLVALAMVHEACKDSTRARALLAQVKQRPDVPLMAVYIAMVHARAQQPDSAFAWLKRARWLPQTYWVLRENHELDPLRSDPRFRELLRSLHMP